ncbi:blue-sensitive opsin-like [Microplitis mediator]|uniref:blue-sensitive opsin-like n=1 Tax=Microplitis mediator TaxID=375433 RepID=UPI002557C334|nr:blue-sensitive opsin-like [Microplitis mediator]
MTNHTNEIKNNEIIYDIITAVLGFIGVFGTLLNLFVIIVIIKDSSKKLWIPINITVLSLASGEFLVGLFGDPFTFTSAYNRGWYWSYDTCIWYAWFMSTLGLSSIGHLTVMATERWFMIVKPMYLLTIKSSWILAVCVWIYAFCLSLPPLVGWGKYGFEAANLSCSVLWEINDPSTHNDTYIAFLFLFGFIVPVVIIITAYIGIISRLKKSKKLHAKAVGKRERKVTIMVAVMITAFMVAWTPYAMFALAAQYFSFKLTGLVSTIPSILAKSSICYNPIIYAGLNPQFHKALKEMFRTRDTIQITMPQKKRKFSNLQTNTTRV